MFIYPLRIFYAKLPAPALPPHVGQMALMLQEGPFYTRLWVVVPVWQIFACSLLYTCSC